MLHALLRTTIRYAVAQRYQLTVRGLERVARRGTRGILFLPNHPALIDPLLLMALLNRPFRPRPLADEDQIDRPVIRWLARYAGVIPIPDVKSQGNRVKRDVEAALETCAETLRRGGNILLYPAGHLYRSGTEDLRGNSAAYELARAAPTARIVAVRTHGLWGSRLSLAWGEFPNLRELVPRLSLALLQNALVFMPRRPVTIEFAEPDDLPRDAGRKSFNRALERFYNAAAPPATYVAYRRDERIERRTMAEPRWGRPPGALDDVPQRVRQRVLDHLREISGAAQLHDTDSLARDLGLDSLARADLLLWLAHEFGVSEPDGEALDTVGDVLLAACGEAIVLRPTAIAPPPPRWFHETEGRRARVPEGDTITEVFLRTAARAPGRLAVADQIAGARSYRQLVTAILALKPQLARLPGERIGIMLPASVGATVVYLAALFAGKTPLMVNWTTGIRNVRHSLDLAEIRHVLTAGPLVTRLEAQGLDVTPLRDRLLPLESLRSRIGWPARLAALLQAWLHWGALRRVHPPEDAVILVTSGSESLPKAVPLTHANLLTNVRDLAEALDIRTDDRLLGFLPPFHSFGLTGTMVAPLLLGLRTAYHPNPTEALILTRLIHAFGVTILIGTPTFLSGILRAADEPRWLAKLRVAVTGAEKCPPRTYEALARCCPQATVLEGYGITECSPVVAVNRLDDPRPGTIGKPLPSLETAVVDVERGTPVASGERGMLLVRGPSVFRGYLGDTPSPFVEHDGRSWYRTGDLVTQDEDGVLTFQGRLKRFVKIGGEMISLPAIEAALTDAAGPPQRARPPADGAPPADEGPALAVVAATRDTRPELVLFAVRDLDRESANRRLREAGLSGLHNIQRVVRVDAIPQLGNGKTDYRALERELEARDSVPDV